MNLLLTKSRADGFQLNESKCKELRIAFKVREYFRAWYLINNTNVEVVPSSVHIVQP